LLNSYHRLSETIYLLSSRVFGISLMLLIKFEKNTFLIEISDGSKNLFFGDFITNEATIILEKVEIQENKGLLCKAYIQVYILIRF